MTNFWAISLFWALFFLFIGVALAFVLPPLLRRDTRSGRVDRKEVNIAIYHDQLAELKADLDSGELDAAQYEDAKREIEKRLSEDVPLEAAPATTQKIGRWPGYVLAVAIPVLAIAIYMILGNPDALVASHADAPAIAGGQHDAAPMIAALEAKLKKKPDDAAGWYMLARSYGSLGRYDDAARAFARLTELVPEDSSILAAYADVLAMTQGGNLQGKPLELVNKALKLNDKDELALNLAGTAAYKAKDFALAAAYWRRLLKVIPADADYAKEIRAAADEAEKAAGGSSGSDNLTGSSGKNGGVEKGRQPPKGSAATISGTVTVARDIAAKVSPSDTVFIFAQLPQGPKMPLASLKIGARQLPYRFTLDDSLAMTPNDSLSRHPEVVVSARISKTGEAMPHSGDLQGKTGTVKLGQQELTIVIDTVLP
ncbi:MAG TPA: c-type cytochrome biogenesis protein CcmI [Sulfuricella sp.]|nr:c-type cytochrome biogenesis protein CcmI [Sulfuricella sp.]